MSKPHRSSGLVETGDLMINPRLEHLPQPRRQRQHDLATTRASDRDRARVPTDSDDRVAVHHIGGGAHTTTLPALRAALDAIPTIAWPTPTTYQATQVTHGYSRIVLVTAGHWSPDAEPFRPLIEPLGEAHDVLLTKLEPGGFIVPHTDASRWRERWHIPIQTAGYTVLDNALLHPADGTPFRVKHWLPHSVRNHAGRSRIHLIVDLDRWAGPTEPAPFRIL